MKNLYTIGLLILSNTFMTVAWYGHLKFKEMKWSESLGLVSIILISWAIAFFEYCFQVPANRIGFQGNNGPFSLMELKVIQEVITLTVFVVFSLVVFKTETFRMNHLIGFIFLVLAVYFIFKKQGRLDYQMIIHWAVLSASHLHPLEFSHFHPISFINSHRY